MPIDPRAIDPTVAAAAEVAHAWNLLAHLRDLGVERIDLTEEQLAIIIREDLLLERLGLPYADTVENRIHLTSKVGRVRRGHELRLVVPSEDHPVPPALEQKLIALLGEAIAARELVLSEGSLSINQIASKHQRCRTRLAKLVRISWLAPDIVRGISDGSIAGITTVALLAAELPTPWREHRAALHAA
jgi:site-specific DNA recombinase